MRIGLVEESIQRYVCMYVVYTEYVCSTKDGYVCV